MPSIGVRSRYGPSRQAFKRNDAIRAVESARAAGIDPGMLEVVVNSDGSTTFRVYADRVVPPAHEPIIRSARE
jgi:hypothetical protein